MSGVRYNGYVLHIITLFFNNVWNIGVLYIILTYSKITYGFMNIASGRSQPSIILENLQVLSKMITTCSIFTLIVERTHRCLFGNKFQKWQKDYNSSGFTGRRLMNICRVANIKRTLPSVHYVTAGYNMK